MTELYLIFIGVAILLFASIIGYSYLQKWLRTRDANKPLKSQSKPAGKEPLLTELEAQKKAAFEQQKSQQAGGVESPATSPASSKKQAPSMGATTSEKTSDTTVDSESSPTSLGKSSPSNKRLEQDSPPIDLGDSTLKKDASSNIITELVARVKNPEPIEQQDLLTLLRLHDFKFHRKINLYGLNQLTDRWCDIEFELPAARFTELGISIQLADRNGAMSSKELHDFQQMTLAFTEKYNAPFEFSFDIDEALKQAQLLDEFGRRYDSMAVLNVVPRSRGGFRIADVESCAREMMLSPDKKGIFVKSTGTKSDLTVLYRLACTDGKGHFGVSDAAGNTVHDLVIYMNVPATQKPDRVFQDMVKDANNLATWLEGKVVDRHGKVMTQRSYSMLMQQISDIAYSMQQDGLMPGDEVSKKLF